MEAINLKQLILGILTIAGSVIASGCDTGFGIEGIGDTAQRAGDVLTGSSNDAGTSSNCAPFDCGPNGRCAELGCICESGFQNRGQGCVDVDECQTGDACHVNAQCVNTPGGFECSCLPGYRGDGVECEDIHECNDRLDNCSDFAHCSNTDGGFECICREGFVGDGIACIDDDECRGQSPCPENSRCSNLPGSFQCDCRPGWMLVNGSCVDVEECSEGVSACIQNARCDNTIGGYDCQCLPGFEGDGRACRDINECDADPALCGAHSSCLNVEGSFRCACDPGFSEVDGVCVDINECLLEQHRCDLGATCVNEVGDYRCVCPTGFRVDGRRCVDIDECAGGDVDCGLFGRCINSPGSYECGCRAGFGRVGDTCRDIDECALGWDDCAAFGECINRSGTYECRCPNGFRGDGRICEDVNECAGGGVACAERSICANTPGSFECICAPGFRLSEGRCVNIDECAEGQDGCSVNAICQDNEGGYRCECAPGYQGDGVNCRDIDECEVAPGPCPVGVACQNLPGSYQCGGEARYLCDCDAQSPPDCVPGSADAAGENPESPVRTVSDLDLSRLPLGTNLLYCAGGAFSERQVISSQLRCSKDEPCVIASYSPSNQQPAPRLTGGMALVDAVAGQSGAFISLEGLAFQGMGEGTGLEIDGWSDVSVNNVSITDWARGIQIGDVGCEMDCSNVERISIEHSLIANNQVLGARLQGDHISMTSCELRANGSGEPNQGQVWLRCERGRTCGDVSLVGNVFRNTSGANGGPCGAAAIGVTGQTTRTRIVGNDIQEQAVTSDCRGVELRRAVDGGGTRFSHAYVGHNRVVNTGAYSIAISSCEDCVVENNELSQSQATFSIAINAPVRRGGGEHALLERLLVRNNSIYQGPEVMFTSIAVKVGGSGRGHRILSNAVVNLSEARTTCCFDQTFDLSIYDAFDHNVCILDQNNAQANWALGFPSLESWQRQSGYDLNSLAVDPGFTEPEPPTADFSARDADAPMVDRGHPVLSTRVSIDGRPRLVPDVGAREWVAP